MLITMLIPALLSPFILRATSNLQVLKYSFLYHFHGLQEEMASDDAHFVLRSLEFQLQTSGADLQPIQPEIGAL